MCVTAVKQGHGSRLDLPRPILPGREKWVELYDFAWELARKNTCHNPDLPAPYYMDEGFAPDKRWQWDTCFMAMFCRYAHDLFPGIESLDNFYAAQRDDGYISMTHLIPSGEDAYPLPPTGRINPPLPSWAELEYYKVTGDTDRLPRVLKHLTRYDAWVEKNRRREDGSYWFVDCGSAGMDNSPRAPRADHRGSQVAFIDLASQQALSASCISYLAAAAGDDELAASFADAYRARSEFVNAYHWNERHHFYYDRHRRGSFVNCKTIASFWPLLAGIANKERVAALVEHLQNPQEFNRPNPIPSLSYDECNYHDDGTYWLGGVWAPTNYMVVRGLMQNGYHGLARDIASRYLDTLDRVWRKYEPHTLWECYAPETDAPAIKRDDEIVRPDFVGWTGLGPIAMLIETVLGLDINYPDRTITWRPTLLEEHGIDNLRFGPHRINLRVAARSSPDETPRLTTDLPDGVQIVFSLE